MKDLPKSINVRVKRIITAKFGVTLYPNRVYEAERNGPNSILVCAASSVWIGVTEKEVEIVTDPLTVA